MTAVDEQTGWFRGAGEIELFARSWLPEAPRGAVIVVHGFGDHSGRYDALVRPLLAAGYAVHTFDLRGHGRSQGARGHIDSWMQFQGDLRAFVVRVRTRSGDLPIVLFGHSLGGLMALNYAEHVPDGLAGVIASAPALSGIGVPPVLVGLGRVLARVVPRFGLSLKGNPDALSRDPAVLATLAGDPLCHTRATARFSTEFFSAMERTLADAPLLKLPLLILQGDADVVVSPEGSRRFYETAGSVDKRSIVYPGGRHEPHHDPHHDLNAEESMRDVVGWLDEHFAQPNTSGT